MTTKHPDNSRAPVPLIVEGGFHTPMLRIYLEAVLTMVDHTLCGDIPTTESGEQWESGRGITGFQFEGCREKNELFSNGNKPGV